MPTILTFIFYLALLFLLLGLLWPKIFSFLFKTRATRKTVFLFFGGVALASFIAIGVISSEQKTTKVEVTMVRPTANEDIVRGVAFQGALVNVTLRYADATQVTYLLFDQVDSLTQTERVKALNEAKGKWDAVSVAAEDFATVVNALPTYELPVTYEQSLRNPLVKPVVASALEDTIKKLEDEERRLDGEIKVSKKETEIGRKKILELVDQAPPGQRLLVAAAMFGTDAKTAQEQLARLQRLEAKINIGQAEVFNNYSNAAEIVKTGVKVELFIGGLAASSGGSAIVMAGKTGVDLAVATANFVFTGIAGAGVTMDVAETAVKVGIADKDGYTAAVAGAKEAAFFKEMSLIVGIMDPLKAYGQFQKISTAAGGVKNLMSPEGLKKVAANKTLIADLKTDVPGNLQIIAESGPKSWDFFTSYDQVKSLLFDTKMPGQVLFKGDQHAVGIADIVKNKLLSLYIQTFYANAATLAAGQTATLKPTPVLKARFRIIKVCSSGLLTVYTDCGTGKKVSKEWAKGSARGVVNAGGESVTPKISGGRGTYTFTVWLDNGESLAVANYDGPSNVATLTNVAKEQGWTISKGTVRVPMD